MYSLRRFLQVSESLMGFLCYSGVGLSPEQKGPQGRVFSTALGVGVLLHLRVLVSQKGAHDGVEAWPVFPLHCATLLD